LGSIPRQIEGTQFGAIQAVSIPPEFIVGAQNMTVNCRRSAATAAVTGAGFGCAAASTGSEAVERLAPHWEQNFA
jgi:hypothetical protein